MLMTHSNKPLISVVIPTFTGIEYLKLSLPCYLCCPRVEVVIGLDGDNRGVRNYLEKFPVTISLTRRRQGLCTATNLAAREAHGDYLLIVNDDMVPSPNWADLFLKYCTNDTVVSAVCWEPGLIPVPPCFMNRSFGNNPDEFRIDNFNEKAKKAGVEAKGKTELGINYPFLIPRGLWDSVNGLDERFNPGAASDPDLFIRLVRLSKPPRMVRVPSIIFYHFASRSSIFRGGKESTIWKLHVRRSRYLFRHKWRQKTDNGVSWSQPIDHRFGEIPKRDRWTDIVTRPEPLLLGKLWRLVWFGPAGRHSVIKGDGTI